MIFFPYRAQISLTKIPYVTISVVVLCLAIYFLQERNAEAIYDRAQDFCAQKVSSELQHVLGRTDTQDAPQDVCATVFVDYHGHPDKPRVLEWSTASVWRPTANGRSTTITWRPSRTRKQGDRMNWMLCGACSITWPNPTPPFSRS